MRSAGRAAARLLSPLFSSRIAQTGISDLVRFLEAMQGIGTGAVFTRRELNAIFRLVKGDAPVIFDVGAHTGEFLAHARSGSVIHAFEPCQRSFDLLSQKFTQVKLNKCALSDVCGTGTLFCDAPGSQLASLTERPGFTQSEPVQLETLDRYCGANSITQIDLLKLDVEGHELKVMEGATELFARSAIHRILFEFGGCNIDSRIFFRDLYQFLSQKGMRLSRLTPAGSFQTIEKYDESLERFRTTNYLATLSRLT